MSVRIALGGDVNFSPARGQIALLVRRRRPPLPKRLLRRLGAMLPFRAAGDDFHCQEIREILLEEYGGSWRNPCPEIESDADPGLPLRGIGSFFRGADIGFVNLETPLSRGGRHVGSFRSRPEYARTLAAGNIRVVSIANNHSFDAGEGGFRETLQVLREQGVLPVGGGMDVLSARAGEVVTIRGLRLGFLAYTAICNSFFISLAKRDQPGILPLFEPMVLEDIAAMRQKCDFLVVAPHFDVENTARVHRNSIALAHRLIDHGADLIVGSHSHVPKPIETYRGKLIIYSLGNLVFTYASRSWRDGLVAEVTVSAAGECERARFFPIATGGAACFSPRLQEGPQASRYLRMLQRRSERKFALRARLQDGFLEIADFNSPSRFALQDPPRGQ
ncbi:MAG: CapA family protein [Candidatus Aminicenantes bacterium]|nr:CapA family protein [Candidatus Aminicenantes bacterium]